jgi:hypothetical protein
MTGANPGFFNIIAPLGCYVRVQLTFLATIPLMKSLLLRPELPLRPSCADFLFESKKRSD